MFILLPAEPWLTCFLYIRTVKPLILYPNLFSYLLCLSLVSECHEHDACHQHPILADEGKPSLLDPEGLPVQRLVSPGSVGDLVTR